MSLTSERDPRGLQNRGDGQSVPPRAVMWLSLLGAALAIGADLLYLTVASSQAGPEPPTARIPITAVLVGVFAVMSGAGWRVPNPVVGVFFLALSAGGLAVLGVLGILSVGLLFLIAAAPVGAATMVLLSSRFSGMVLTSAASGVVAAVVILLASVYLTEFPSSCAQGELSGGGSTWFHGDYTYNCDRGRLTLHTH